MALVKCFQCKEKIEKEMAKHYVYETQKSKSNRYFHEECYELHFKNKEEKKKLDEICNYVKKEIFRLDDEKIVPPHFVNRLLGLKSGKHTLTKGAKIYGNEKSYSYEVIYNTIKIQKINIINGISNNTKFKNDQHKIDYMFAIITNNINDVYFRMKANKESEDRVENINLDDNFNFNNEFINKNNINDNKVANKLNHLF